MELNYVVPDTLVLKIEEHDTELDVIDTTLYILYDTRTDRYVIRGNRRSTLSIKSNPYSFETETVCGLSNFVEFIICPENIVSYTLSNYDNLPENSYDITYELLKLNDKRENEVVGYDYQKVSKKILSSILIILRNVFNYY